MARPAKKDNAQQKQKSLAVRFAIAWLRAYQWLLSPWIGNQCRFYPSCSHYAVDAYETWGFFRGTWLTLNRLRKCHPWHKGGIDPVPAHCNKETACRTELCEKHKPSHS